MMADEGTFPIGSEVSFREMNPTGGNLIGTGVVRECDGDLSCGLRNVLYKVEILTCKDDWPDAGATIYLLHKEIKEVIGERH